MLFAGWEVDIGKNCARGLENSFSQNGPTSVRSSSGSLREFTGILSTPLSRWINFQQIFSLHDENYL